MAAPQVIQDHPNTMVATGSGTVGVGLVWLLGHFGVKLTSEEAVAIAGGLTSILLFIGRRGIRGALIGIWRGATPAAKPPAA